ncbi:hypothetical protein BY996DRAFT_6598140 [Phakopsora pachyrhizi]|nr:hypothetical protein BY996DRAFT_6598140 [Phakopsora pachyrhizi]
MAVIYVEDLALLWKRKDDVWYNLDCTKDLRPMREECSRTPFPRQSKRPLEDRWRGFCYLNKRMRQMWELGMFKGHVDELLGVLEERWIKRKAELTIDDKNHSNKD